MATVRKKKPVSAAVIIHRLHEQFVFSLGGGTYQFDGSYHGEKEYTVRLVPVEVVRQPTIVLKMPSNATEADLMKALAAAHEVARKPKKRKLGGATDERTQGSSGARGLAEKLRLDVVDVLSDEEDHESARDPWVRHDDADGA